MHHRFLVARFVFSRRARLAAAGLLALALGLPAWSQGTGSSGSTPGTGSPATSQTGSASRSVDETHELVEDLAHAHLAEIDAGRLALEKTQSAPLRSFAQQMIDDHTQALQELQQLGQKKKLTVPRETDFQHKAIATALRLLSGNTFDRQYIRQVGIRDHRRTLDLLHKAQTGADPELKAHAGKLMPVIERHLASAREIDRTLK